MREQVELLEHHADVLADGADVLGVLVELDAVDVDRAAVVFLKTVHAADERGFP